MGNSRSFGLLSTIIIVIAIVILIIVSGCVEVGELQTESRSVDLEDADSVEVELDMSSGEMNVAGGADKLLNAEFKYNIAAWKPEIEYSVTGGKGKLKVHQPTLKSTFGPVGLDARNEWDLRLKDDVPMDLSIAMSSGECDFNMDSSMLKTLDIESSSGSFDAALFGSQSLLENVEMDISSGASSLDLSGEYPSLSEMVIESSSGSVDVELTGNYSALRLVDIDVSSGNAFLDITGNLNSDLQIDMTASSGNVILSLPRDVGVYAYVQTSSGSIKASDFRLEGDHYVNDAYGESEVTVNVMATSSSANIELLMND